ncbi:autotransporter outer membrane beta-barrel domain-containing protein [Lawsonia intracellularis]|uniref:NA n=1 Tax=Lawsonia intracellularis (strain PHE/MN1-00) TaxID=363253 RepID=Q1MQM4_LAWIP|nr:autotransporter outer membrane beta-barrel domain-containing protein [Lawsonia intracellularis]AGC50069.1 hypothetical protein LAW_00671 [Lawsonia intracellularis N343]MBZ3893133.1 autotransporter outer membrane beta-barrel domain-containing protein [Lawsonia intracellularis]RBN33322.1 hypothetical protein DR194_02720 [Lawsonia intracellularis]CAJ54703.1 NA [Lawsonia intracellularis PHE/MN1-00]
MAYLSISKNQCKSFLITLVTIFIMTSIPQLAEAVEHFANGVPTVVQDVNVPADSYFGGADSAVGPNPIASTHLTISTTQGFGQNALEFVVGGSLANGNGNPANINGDIVLIVENTNTQNSIIGGSMANAAPVTIGGSIFMTLRNVTAVDPIFGGSVDVRFFAQQQPNEDQLVGGDININLENVTTPEFYGLGYANGVIPVNVLNRNFLVAVQGNITTNISNSNIATVMLGSHYDTTMAVGGNGTINVDNSTIGYLSASNSSDFVNPDLTNTVTFNIGPNNRIANIFASNNGVIPHFIVNMDGSGTEIQELTLGNVIRGGLVLTSELNLSQGTINNLITGNEYYDRSGLRTTVNVRGGTIGVLTSGGSDYSELNFIPGEISTILATNSIGNQDFASLSQVTIHQGAETLWGMRDEVFELQTNNLQLGGELFIPADGTGGVALITNHIIANSGVITPVNMSPERMTPIIGFLEPTGEVAQLTIYGPLTVNLSHSPEILGKIITQPIPIAVTNSDVFGTSKLFVEHNTKGLIWSDIIFNPQDKTWYLTNFRGSEDFYGLSAAREASNWLRQQHIWSLQRRSNKLLDHGVDGLWMNVQGGYEKLDAAIGDAKMPWIMASLGYDFMHKLSDFYNLKALYGFGFGFATGKNKWNTINSTTNDIYMGLVGAYVGLMHEATGLYGTVSGQFATNRTKTKCTGFDETYNWKENVPTEAIEIGWKWSIDEFKINPRGQVIFEQLSKHHFSLSQEGDTAILDKEFLTTTVIGISGEYDLDLRSKIIKLQASVDWIKGISGDFAAKSEVLNMKFKDKNDTSTFRGTLGASAQLLENFEVHLDIFGDLGNDKGIGGQVGATYRF